jgi:hypothetical protein
MADTKLELRDPTKEHIAGAEDAFMYMLRRALPQYIDDVTKDYGNDTYERMLTDPAVNSAFSIIKEAVLADDIQLVCAVEAPSEESSDPGQQAEHEESDEYRAFVQRCLDGSATPILDVAEELLDGLALGHKVAEVVMRQGDGEDAGRLVLKAIKPRPRKNMAFVVDNAMDAYGVIAINPEHPTTGVPVLAGPLQELGDVENFVPMEQLLIFRWASKNGDPRGTSILRSAYNPWFLKTRVYPDYFKYLKQFASPSLIGKTNPEGSGFVPVTNEDGTIQTNPDETPKVVSDTYALLASLLQFINSSALVVPGGTEVDTLFSQGEGEAFLKANDYFDRQISLGILKTTRLNQEAQHGSKADSGTAENVTGTRIRRIRKAMEDCLNKLSKFLIRLNYGPEAEKLAPKFSLASQEAQDWATELSAVSGAYANGFIHDSQLQELDKRLNLPPRDMEAIAQEKAERQHQEMMRSGDLSKVLMPEAA